MQPNSALKRSNLLEVGVGSLKAGMFVAELDRPWLETPFALQGFFINDDADAAYVAKHCANVFIDPRRSVSTGLNFSLPNDPPSRDTVSIKREFSRAKVDFESASQSMEKVFSQIKTSRHVDVDAVQKVIRPLIDSVFRNREALAALIRMKDKDDYFFNHCLSTAVWAAVLGRHLALDKDALQDLALGASMIDVGMASLPDELLNKTGELSESEIDEIRSHVKVGVKLIRDSGIKNPRILNIIACHHERYDGSGYPNGIDVHEIPMMARLAGLADTYDAMITNRPHAKARSSFEAMQELTDLKDIHFQGALVEQFIQTIGMFPTGAIVELNTGEVGVVVQQNSNRRLRPKVVLILDSEKHRRHELIVRDLSKYMTVADGRSTQWISRELPSGAYDVKPDDYFL